MGMDDERAIISVTVLPSRLPHCRGCIESLAGQGLPLYVWAPEEVERTGDVFEGWPEWMQGLVDFATVTADRGPIGKLLSALPLADIVLTADDDVVYGDGWADGLLEWHGRMGDVALGYRGRVFRDRRYNNSRLVVEPSKPMTVDLLTGTWGALYRADWFADSIYDEWCVCRLNDDIVINAHLKRRGVQRVVIPKECEIEPLAGVHQIDALWVENRHRNDYGLDAVEWWA